jgi:dihydroorotase (multifunctional complex type)
MPEFETLINGGRALVAGVLEPTDLLIDGGRIVALFAPGTAPVAQKTIDATGKVVLPGIIDTHAHTRDPGLTQKEDFYTASQAAAAGGVTTIIDMPNVEPPTVTLEQFLEKREDAGRKSIVDYGHWVGGVNPVEITKMAEAGATGYKIFQVSGAYPHDPRLAINDDGKMLQSFRAVADTGLPLLVHPFNQSLFEQLSADRLAAGEPSNWETFSSVYTTDAIWRTAVNSLIALQELSGVRLQLLHTHSGGSLKLIRAAKERGQRITASIDPKYYHLDLADLRRLTGRIAPAGFVPEDEERMAEIWRSLNDGTIDMIDSDHAPHTLEEIKQQDIDAWDAAMGSPQYDWQYSMMLTDVADGHLTLARAVELLAEAPAKLLGIFPRKGALLPGSDADLVIVDLERQTTLTDDGLYTKAGWTPYLGRTVTGYVEHTMLRGTSISINREVIGQAGFGDYIEGVAQ